MVMAIDQITSHRTKQLYDGFEIEATAIPMRVPEGSFTVHFDINKHGGGQTDATHFESGLVFTDVNDALRAGIAGGKQKIDEGFKPIDIIVNK